MYVETTDNNDRNRYENGERKGIALCIVCSFLLVIYSTARIDDRRAGKCHHLPRNI